MNHSTSSSDNFIHELSAEPSFSEKVTDIQTLPCQMHHPHWHDAFEFLYVLSGKLEVHINHKAYIASAGEGFFLNARQIHYIKKYQEYDGVFASFLIEKDVLCQNEQDPVYEKYIFPVINNPSFSCFPLVPKIPWQKYILENIKKMLEICRQKTFGYELKIQHFINEIFYYIIRNHNNIKQLSLRDIHDIDRLRTAMSYLENSYQNRLTLADISSSCHLSRSECCRLFQRILQSSPIDYLLRLRIQKSLPLILAHKISMGQIAKEVGFSGSSYFSETFKKVIGCSPRDYYKQHNL